MFKECGKYAINKSGGNGMYREEKAELKDVDLILDFKLDVVFNSKEVASMERNEMEKLVNYIEEEIRENIDKYNLVYDDDTLVAAYLVDDYADGKMIDLIYVVLDKRQNGIGNYILSNIIERNFQKLYAWIYKENEIIMHMLKKNNFIIEEESDFKFLMKCENDKKENNDIKIKLFKEEVDKLAKKYEINYKLECKMG